MKILDALSRAPPRGFSIQEIIKETGLSRATVSKYVLGLEANKRIDVETVGTLKLVRLAGGRGA